MKLLFIGALVALLAVGWRSNVLGSVSTWWQLRNGTSSSPNLVENDLFTGVLASRQQLGMDNLAPDARLHEWLDRHLKTGDEDAGTILDEMQTAFPEYQSLAALRTWAPTQKDLSTRLETWQELSAADYSHLVVVARASWGNLGWKGWAVAGQRLPHFAPEAIGASPSSAFYSVCALCGKGQSCQISGSTRSISLECSGCRRTYAAIASGSDGTYRYINEFLNGYTPPAHYPAAQNGSRLPEMMSIWRAVSSHCRYIQDTGTEDNDAWQTARETHLMGQGDCEDSAILLADWLLARGFQARVALGRYAERGGHAWVVARLDGEDYLLESTENEGGAMRAPLLRLVGSRYIPEMLFDRETIYVRQEPHALWEGDYWSESTWIGIRPRAHPAP